MVVWCRLMILLRWLASPPRLKVDKRGSSEVQKEEMGYTMHPREGRLFPKVDALLSSNVWVIATIRGFKQTQPQGAIKIVYAR